MTARKKKQEFISFPIAVFQTAETKDDLENWLLANNPDFIKRMRKAREEDLGSRGKTWTEFKKEKCIK
jgi:hypothetical protein